MDDEKITIIEGPPPTFEAVEDGWTLGLYEGPMLSDIAVTRLRTFNGPALVERCNRAWRKQQTIHLEYRETDGLEQSALIVAARYVETDEGQLLILWVRLPKDDMELELDYVDDDDDIDDQDDLDDIDDDDDEIDDLNYPLGPTDWTM